MTTGEILFYGGIAGTICCIIIVLIAVRVFNKRRNKKLKEIMENL